jgi:6-phosphogluconolactonase
VAGHVADWRRAEEDPNPTLVLDPQPMARAGELIFDALADRLERSASVRLAIPGGSALEAMPRVQQLLGDGWSRVALTWVDERCVPIASGESNRGAAARLGLVAAEDQVPDPRGPALVLPLYEDGETPVQALSRVRSRLTRDFDDRLDVVLLGMGPDGHVASLFPSRAMPTQGLVAHVDDSPKPPTSRITLTRRALATAQDVILVATGEAKRNVVRRLMSGDEQLPAQGLDGLVIVTDVDPRSKPEMDRKGG